ncbi:MAG TPA: MFS transporter [Gaiellaceae bacterium]|nr:MFS transporter [Gaiellaceae bacterium]
MRRALDRLSTLADVFRNPELRRLELAWAGYYAGEWTHFVALSLYAYDVGGATAVGVLGLVRLAPAAIALPVGSTLSDRYPRQRVLLVVNLARAASLGAAALALALDAPTAAVFSLAALAAVFGAPVRPATLSLVPLLARSPQELVAANVSSSTLEGLGTLVGPVIGGVLVAVSGPDVAVAAAAVLYVGCAVLVGAIRRAGDVSRRRTDHSMSRELLGGARALSADSRPRLIVLLFASQSMVRGLLNVLVVVAAIELLDMGASGVGWLNAALGAGGLLGGLAAVALVGRRRLAAPFGLGLVLWGLPITLTGLVPHALPALLFIAVIGIGNAILDVSGYTIMQRTVDEHVLGRVFGVFEILVTGAAAIGSLLASLLLAALDVRAALVVVGTFLPALAALTAARLRAIDATTAVPEQELALLASTPLFAPLPITTLERLAAHVRPVHAAAGSTVVEEGGAGDRFYLIGDGEVDVVHEGRRIATLGPGDYFGEIALLHDVPRVATCVARTDLTLFALDREPFAAAVSGDHRSATHAEDVMTARLSEL